MGFCLIWWFQLISSSSNFLWSFVNYELIVLWTTSKQFYLSKCLYLWLSWFCDWLDFSFWGSFFGRMLDGSFIGRLSVLIYLFLGCRERSLGIRGWGVFIWWGGERVSECRVLCSIGGSGKIIPLKLLTIASMFWYFQRVKSFKNTPLNFSSPKIHEINSYMFFISLFSSNITH